MSENWCYPRIWPVNTTLVKKQKQTWLVGDFTAVGFWDFESEQQLMIWLHCCIVVNYAVTSQIDSLVCADEWRSLVWNISHMALIDWNSSNHEATKNILLFWWRTSAPRELIWEDVFLAAFLWSGSKLIGTRPRTGWRKQTKLTWKCFRKCWRLWLERFPYCKLAATRSKKMNIWLLSF